MDLRTRAELIREQGTATRRDWNPKPNSIHWRVYRWWIQRTKHAPERENFCHYWRVVAFWAPLMWLTQPLRSRTFWFVMGSIFIVALCSLLVFAAITGPAAFLAVVVAVVVAAWLWFGTIYSYYLAYRLFDDPEGEDDNEVQTFAWMNNKSYAVFAPMTLMFLPVVVFWALFGLVVFAIFGSIAGLFQHFKVHKRIARLHPARYPWVNPWTVLAALAVAVLVFFALRGNEFAGVLLVAIVIFGMLLGFVMTMSWLGDVYRRYRETKRDEAKAADYRRGVDFLIRLRFKTEHPEHADDDSKYRAWRVRYDRYFNSRFGDVYDPYDVWEHARFVSKKLEQHLHYFTDPEELGQKLADEQAIAEEQDTIGDKIADTGSFIWSIVLTRKWRICPIIQRPTTD